MSLLGAAVALGAVFDKLGVDYAIIGGAAVIARGLPRHTEDVDAAIWGPDVDLDRLVEALSDAGFALRTTDAVDFARTRQVLLLVDTDRDLPIDVSLAWMPFEREALDRAAPLDTSLGRIVTATAEDLVVFKAVAWRPQDIADVERLVELHGREMDLDRVRRWVSKYLEVLEVPERMEEVDAVIERALAVTATAT